MTNYIETEDQVYYVITDGNIPVYDYPWVLFEVLENIGFYVGLKPTDYARYLQMIDGSDFVIAYDIPENEKIIFALKYGTIEPLVINRWHLS